MGKMLIFSAPSGAGKTTIVKEILKKKELNLEFSISACSRAKRETETEAVDYYFFSVAGFKQKIEKNEVVEWEQVYENQYYGTLKSEVERIWNNCNNVVFDVDVVGGMNIKKQYNDTALSIFIKPPSLEILKDRLINRKTESSETLKKRLDKAEWELNFADQFDVVIINDKLEDAINEVMIKINKFLEL
jgi:guanylate kinase